MSYRATEVSTLIPDRAIPAVSHSTQMIQVVVTVLTHWFNEQNLY